MTERWRGNSSAGKALRRSEDLRARLAEAEAQLPALEHAFQEAALAELIGDDPAAADVTQAAKQALQRHRGVIEKLKAALPASERAEAAALEDARASIKAAHVTKLSKELRELEREGLKFSVAVELYCNRWRSLSRKVEAVSELLQRAFPALCDPVHGYLGAMGQLQPESLCRAAKREVARLGLSPILDASARRWNAPSAAYEDLQDIHLWSQPDRAPNWADQVKQICADILRLAKGEPAPSAEPLGSETGTRLQGHTTQEREGPSVTAAVHPEAIAATEHGKPTPENERRRALAEQLAADELDRLTAEPDHRQAQLTEPSLSELAATQRAQQSQQEEEQRAQRQAASVAPLAAAEPAAGHLADDSNRMFTLDLRAGQPSDLTEGENQ